MNESERDRLLGGLDERTLAIKSTLDERTETIVGLIEAHNGRIRLLEIWQARALAGSGIVGVIVVVAQADVREFVATILGG